MSPPSCRAAPDTAKNAAISRNINGTAANLAIIEHARRISIRLVVAFDPFVLVYLLVAAIG
jgi:hypothetical protein